ncbi:MAG: hypothetical protein ACJ8EB_10525 [Allosphingosinicella sp.]
MARFPLPPLAGIAALFAASCADDGTFPSLAQRPAEKAYAEERDAPEPAPPAIPEDPALAGRVAAAVAEGEAGRAAFDAAYETAAGVAARAGARGSDGWIQAQQALSRAVAAQAQTTKALADLDQLAASRAAAAPMSEADLARLKQGTARVQTIADAQAERVARLAARLSGR